MHNKHNDYIEFNFEVSRWLKATISLSFSTVYISITFAQSPAVDNLYRIALNGTAITVDGDLSDWDDAQWEFLSIDRPAYGILNSISNSGIYPASPSDASAWLAIKMDDNNIYFALNVRDENAPLFAGADDA